MAADAAEPLPVIPDGTLREWGKFFKLPFMTQQATIQAIQAEIYMTYSYFRVAVLYASNTIDSNNTIIPVHCNDVAGRSGLAGSCCVGTPQHSTDESQRERERERKRERERERGARRFSASLFPGVM